MQGWEAREMGAVGLQGGGGCGGGCSTASTSLCAEVTTLRDSHATLEIPCSLPLFQFMASEENVRCKATPHSARCHCQRSLTVQVAFSCFVFLYHQASPAIELLGRVPFLPVPRSFLATRKCPARGSSGKCIFRIPTLQSRNNILPS